MSDNRKKESNNNKQSYRDAVLIIVSEVVAYAIIWCLCSLGVFTYLYSILLKLLNLE